MTQVLFVILNHCFFIVFPNIHIRSQTYGEIESTLKRAKYFWGEWPCGLRHCGRIGWVTAQTPTGAGSSLETQPPYEATGDFLVDN